MSIVTQINNTKFRSLKYGNDRLNGGSSNQPYIQTPILEKSPGTGGPDFLLRGGLLIPDRTLKDVSRITQMFFDTRSPNGLLFTAKQNILSLTEVNTKAEQGDILNTFSNINSKIYSPTSTIAQVAITAEGGHISKQGLVPENILSLLSDSIGGSHKRLENLYNNHIAQSSFLAPVLSTDILYSYSGGPGSIGGIGRTNILLSSDRTGLNNPNIKVPISDVLKTNSITLSTDDRSYRTGVTRYYNTLTNNKFFNDLKSSFNEVTGKSIFKTKPSPGDVLNLTGSLSYTQISEYSSSKDNPSVGDDFRTQLTSSVLYSKSLNYKNGNYEKRTNYNPRPKSTVDYSLTGSIPYDKINASGLYYSSLHDSTGDFNDLVKFRIAVVDNDNPDKATYMHFRAYIDSFSDSYNSDWNSLNYVGRGEKFYRYQGFNREVSLSWTVAAQSKAELIPMYHKLNYLASSFTPNYSKNGYMRGNLVKLTIGGYLYEQPGIITSMTLDIPQESTWEIGIGTDQPEDSSVKELPHIIRVTGVKFIPIHTFTPQLFDKNTLEQRYIALSNGFGKEKNNYSDNTQLYQ